MAWQTIARLAAMSIALPNGSAATYLAALGAAAITVTARLHIGADTVPTLRRRKTTLAWIVWTRSIGDAKQVVDAAKLTTANDLPACVSHIEARADDLQIPLTTNDKACERAAVLARRVDEAMDEMQTSGALRAFNVSYKLHRARMNNRVQPYGVTFTQMRGEVIRFIADTPREAASPAALRLRLRARFKWYLWYG
jgi:hypothetical protein